MEHCHNHKDREGIYYTNAGHNLCPDCWREYLQNKKRGKIAGMGDSLRMAELDDVGLLYYREHQISQNPDLKAEHIERVRTRCKNMWFCPDCGRWVTDENIAIRDVMVEQHRKTHGNQPTPPSKARHEEGTKCVNIGVE